MDKYLGVVLDSRYEILEVIGTGGMAVVYKAKDRKLNRYVAVKILKDDSFMDEELRLRFRTESEAVAQLNHPNIVNIFDVNSTGDMEYIVMELIDGITLYQYMKQRGILPIKESLYFVAQILRALDHAHSRNIIHRDIKPQNMMLLRDGTLKVTDFGIAKIASRQRTLTQSAFGSVHYISPEQARGEQTDGRADIYSVSVMLYEMLTGKLPFEGESPLAIAIKHLNSEPIPPSKINPEIPPALEAIILKAMSASADRRYPSAMAMLDDIEEFKRNPGMVVMVESTFNEDESNCNTKKMDKLASMEYAEPQSAMQDLTPGEAVATADEGGMPMAGKKKLSNLFKNGMMMPVVAGVLTTIIFLAVAGVIFFSVFSAGNASSKQEVKLPNLTGMTFDAVQKLFRDTTEYSRLQLVKESERTDDTVPAGAIIEQKPVANTRVKANSTVNVIVSLGPQTVLVPDVSGQSSVDGINKLKKTFSDNGLYSLVYKEKHETSDTVAKGSIIRTEPATGEAVKEGDVIYVVISNGPDIKEIQMPNLIDLTLDTAETVLSENELTLGTTTEQYSDKPAGTVIVQSVTAGSMVKETSTIDLTISKGPEGSDNNGNNTDDQTLTTYEYTITLPTQHDPDPFTVSVKQDGQEVYNKQQSCSDGSIVVRLVGNKGTSAQVQVYIDDKIYINDVVKFT